MSIAPSPAPYYTDATIDLHHQPVDGFSVLASLPDASVDAVVTDPPYGLEFMGKEWDAPWKASSVGRGARVATEREAELTERGKGHSTSAGPYLASGVDSVRVAGRPFQEWCEQWARECLRVLKPGGHLLAFGGTRTSHRLACAIEDAGFEIRDSIAWLYGSGFPKSLDVSKAINKSQRRNYVLAAAELGLSIPGNSLHDWTKAEHSPGDAWWERFKAHLSPGEWQQLERAVTGHNGRSAGWFTHGDGHDITAPATPDAERWQGWGTALKPAHEPIVVARKPLAGTVAGNVLAHGTGALNIDGCRADVGEGDPLRSATYVGSNPGTAGHTMGDGWANQGESVPMWSGKGRWPANVVLDESQAAELDKQSGTLTSGVLAAHHRRNPKEAGILGAYGSAEGERGYGDEGGASRFFYVAKAGADERVRVNGTAHPTVKPLSLMRWLVRLVTPPGGTVLEPFAGSGTTVEACILEGFRCVAIEREADYLPLIKQRIHRRRDPVEAVKGIGEDGGLFDLLGEETA